MRSLLRPVFLSLLVCLCVCPSVHVSFCVLLFHRLRPAPPSACLQVSCRHPSLSPDLTTVSDSFMSRFSSAPAALDRDFSRMWDGHVDPRRMKTSSSIRGRQLLTRRFPVSPTIPIPPPFHVSPPFQADSPPRPPLRSSPSFPAPSPPLRRLSPHRPYCPPLVVSPMILQHSSSFPSPSAQPTSPARPSIPRPHLSPPPCHHSVSPLSDSRVFVAKELHSRQEEPPRTRETSSLQSVINKKDVKISLLERCLRDLDDRVKRLRSSAARNSEEREEELREMEALRSHCTFMKSQMEQMKQQLGRKDSEILSLRTKLDAVKNQLSDSGQHVNVLKESLRAKEQRTNILQSEVESLRDRLTEKDSLVSQKNQQVSELMEEKISRLTECKDLQDVMEVKERKVEVLLKKLENLQDHLRDKNNQMNVMRDQVKSLQVEASKSDSALAALEGTLAEKEQFIQKMKQQQEANKKLVCKLKVEEEVPSSNQPGPQIGPVVPACVGCLEQGEELSEQETLKKEVERLTELLREAETHKENLEDQVQQLERQVKDQTENLDRLDQSSLKIQMEQLLVSMEKMKQELQMVKDKLTSAQLSLAEKESHLTTLRREKQKHLEDVLAMKQEALLSSISEKAAQLDDSEKKSADELDTLRKEKEDLVRQLRLQTQTRMKLLAEHFEDDKHKNQAEADVVKMSPEQDDEDGVWA